MVSYGPDTQSLNLTHMYSFVDYRSNKIPNMLLTKGSIYDYIHSEPEFSKFKTIIERAGMINQLNSPQANFTIMIPSDVYLNHIPCDYFEYMDDGLARQILACSTINRRIDRELITSSPVSYYVTRNPQMRMFVTNIGGVCNINNCADIVKYNIICNNGIIHIVNNLIAPNEDTFIN